MIKLELSNDFNLDDTVTCGQIFRFDKELDNSYTIILDDRVINIKKEDNTLLVESNNEDNLKNKIIEYFDLDRDYDNINKQILLMDSKLKKVIDSCIGFKIIKQYPFETIMEYIISSNNRVPSIRNSLDKISEKYGKKVTFKNKIYYLFPNYIDLKNVSIDEFRTFKVGFRDKYLYDVVQSINKNDLNIDEIYKLDTDKSLEKLMSFNGVGPKVSSCILLFGYQKFDVFPVDTWVKKIMKEEYNLDTQEKIIKYAKENYKEYSGIVIQYLFHYNRNKK